jgi:hypothetical protein
LWNPNFFLNAKSPLLKRGQKRLDIGLLKVDLAAEAKEPDDTDNDGIYDDEDKCLTIKGEKAYDGCPAPTDAGDAAGDAESDAAGADMDTDTDTPDAE